MIVKNVHTCALGITAFASLQSLSVVMNIQFFFSFLFATDCCLGDYILFPLKEISGRRAWDDFARKTMSPLVALSVCVLLDDKLSQS